MKLTCQIEGCEKPRNGHGLCITHYARWMKHGDPYWAGDRRTGDAVGYAAVHRRLRVQQGHANTLRCVDCGQQAAEWAYDGKAADERRDPSSDCAFTTDLTHYVSLCVPCHKRRDNAASHFLASAR